MPAESINLKAKKKERLPLKGGNNSRETIALYDSLENNVISPWRLSNKKRMEKELKNSIIVEALKGSHTSFLFLSNNFLVETIRSFIDGKR